MPAKEDHERFRSIAEELELEDDERDEFVSASMKRKGYKPAIVWEDPDPEEGKKDGDFFSRQRKEKKGASQDKGKRDWQYGS